MSSGYQRDDLLRVCTLGSAIFVACVALCLVWLYIRLPTVEAADMSSAPADLTWQQPPKLTGLDWSVFHAKGRLSTANAGAAAKRFRFAGTFSITYDGDTDASDAVAILDDMKQNTEKMKIILIASVKPFLFIVHPLPCLVLIPNS